MVYTYENWICTFNVTAIEFKLEKIMSNYKIKEGLPTPLIRVSQVVFLQLT